MNKIVKWAVAMAIAFIIGAICSYRAINAYFSAQIEGLKPKVVEVIKRDTIVAYLPLEIEKRITDTIVVVCRDTIYLPREQKVYEDSTYRAVVSGYQPRLDSISVYAKTIEVTKIATQKEWRKFDYGIQVGFGIVSPLNGNVSLGGYLGFGVTYHF